MKKKVKQLLPVLLLASTLLLTTSSTGSMNWTGNYVPVFMERSELEKSVFFDQEKHALVNPGKIYSKDQFLFINEKYKGIHVIDNSDSRHPEKVGFIVAPGCIDMAVKGNILYLDNAVDLVAIDLTERKVTERIENVFPEPLSPENYKYLDKRPDEKFILVGWNKK
ncbi:MAG: hypothetical protein PHG27_03175 [Massilibacteroides sp.]|nr:hypothetical protein [Massilibacteroides sp.]MDD3064166.1 hypothetical protein [Massilibacteroides sp.]MDD4114590.1 hypothetical protein [Massilibacteroides sp.]MDD4660788.1 hypothetical protein [Massilibacteroides sp.]